MITPRPRLYVVRDEPLELPTPARDRPGLQVLVIVLVTVVVFVGAVLLGEAARRGGW